MANTRFAIRLPKNKVIFIALLLLFSALRSDRHTIHIMGTISKINRSPKCRINWTTKSSRCTGRACSMGEESRRMAAREPDLPNLSEAIRRLVEMGLESAKKGARAAERARRSGADNRLQTGRCYVNRLRTVLNGESVQVNSVTVSPLSNLRLVS